MVNVELSYNPYLMETEIRFNGQPPRVNSLVEKYQNMNLQSWMGKIPKIFHDEMNGYYFELDFTGTELDFEALCNTFRRAGIKDEIVPIVHKRTLGDRITKQNEVKTLLKWLWENRNDRLDYDAFRAENSELFDGGYSYVYLHGQGLEDKILEEMNVSVEHVDRVEELNDTDLTCTPILIHITEKTLQQLAAELNYFKIRPDVTEDQLFFGIGKMLDRGTIDRVIRDLGVLNPKIIEKPADLPVRKYIEVYPITAYIINALNILREASGVVGAELEQDNAESIIKNKAVHEKINSIEEALGRLRNARSFYDRFSDSTPMNSMKEIEQELLDKINDWRGKKTKIHKFEEAVPAAGEFEKDAGKLLLTYAKKIKSDAEEKIKGVREDFETEYKNANYDNFEPDTQIAEMPKMEISLSFAKDLLDINEKRQVEAREDLIGMLFKTLQTEEKQMVLETTYYYAKWREYVAKLVKKEMDNYVDQISVIYRSYRNDLRREYVDHIGAMIEQEDLKKKEVESQLSEDEKLLQIDNEWLEQFNKQRAAIERG